MDGQATSRAWTAEGRITRTWRASTGSMIQTLIIARPGLLRESLQALLLSLPGVQAERMAEDMAAVQRELSAPGPALVLVDSRLLCDELLALMRASQASPSGTRWLFLTDTL